MKRQLCCHEVLADARMKWRARRAFGVMPSNFIWRSHTSFFMHRRRASLKKAARRLGKSAVFRLTCQMMTETQKRLSSDFYYNWNIRINTCSITAKHLYCNNEAFAPQTWNGSFAAMKHSLTLVWSEAHDRLSAWRRQTSYGEAILHFSCTAGALHLKKAAWRLLFSWHPLGESNPQLPLRRWTQCIYSLSTGIKKMQLYQGFSPCSL